MALSGTRGYDISLEAQLLNGIAKLSSGLLKKLTALEKAFHSVLRLASSQTKGYHHDS